VLQAAHARKNLWRCVPADLPAALTRAQSIGVRLGLVSNSEGAIAALLGELGIAHHFEVIVDSGIEGVRKPDPEIFRRALRRMEVTAKEALYIGDVPAVDVEGARAAGMGAVLVDEYGHYPDFTGPRVRSVAELIGRWR
jgi:putative hydrolase of the HAD superfamily